MSLHFVWGHLSKKQTVLYYEFTFCLGSPVKKNNNSAVLYARPLIISQIVWPDVMLNSLLIRLSTSIYMTGSNYMQCLKASLSCLDALKILSGRVLGLELMG